MAISVEERTGYVIGCIGSIVVAVVIFVLWELFGSPTPPIKPATDEQRVNINGAQRKAIEGIDN